MKLVLSSSLLLLASLPSSLDASTAVTVCPKPGSIQRGLKYHADTQCDRAVYNSFKCSLGRHHTYAKFKEIGGVSTVANEKTIKCPANGARVSMVEPNQPASGMDTVWFVENFASTPIVISYVNQDGHEVSAKNPKIAPATADPNAIILPGKWMAVYAFEGHSFTARQVLPNGAAGNVLLQHRAGLYPVGAHADNLSCPTEDVEPVRNNTRAPEFARTAPATHRPCNTLDIGFRNVAACPLHAYYVNSGSDENSCTEDFKFHLGVEQSVATGDFMWDWQSATKYEGTFIGHTFHFRLASNPAVLVDTVTLSPVTVTDCPTNSVGVPIAVGGSAVMDNVGNMHPSGSNNVTGDDFAFVGATNGTLTDASFYSTAHQIM